MSKKSDTKGRAYEYSCLMVLKKEISKVRRVKVEENKSYLNIKKAWNTLTESEKNIYKISALAAIKVIFELEPLILEGSEDELILIIQSDEKGKDGDVRDILIIRKDISWEIGISAKHNHFAVKHSRLSQKLDFGKKWYGIECSEQYWEDVNPIFDYLEKEKKNGMKWKDLPSKEEQVYVPLLNAFKNEINRQNKISGKNIPRLMIEYLLGKFDFYKIISIDDKRITRVQSYNLKGSLNKPTSNKNKINLPQTILPTRIISLEYKPNSKTTLELYMDSGWQFSFRIHNASEKVEPSLKFDIQIIGMPTTIISIDCNWSNKE